MLEAIIKRLKRDRRGVSNVIVVMLSLILVVVIVANVVLWSYQMNQIDWEKMQENITILGVSTNQVFWSYNPSGYALGGSTTWVSGDVSDLTSDDGAYMTFRSYYSGTGTSDFVDNNTSDVDSSADKGTHSNFLAQQAGPDSVYDTLTEENTGGASNTTLIDAESFEGGWPLAGWTETGVWNRESDRAYDGTWSADFDGLDPGRSGNLNTPDLDCSDATAIYVSFYFREQCSVDNEFRLRFWDGSTWDNIEDLGQGYSPGWNPWEMKVTDSQYFKSDFKVRWRANDVESNEHVYVDLVTVKKEVQGDSYELDLEVQWTGVDFDETNEELCIYGGIMGAENITVDVWYNSAWQNVLTDLTSGWNNVSVSSYLISSTLTIRFKDALETEDTI